MARRALFVCFLCTHDAEENKIKSQLLASSKHNLITDLNIKIVKTQNKVKKESADTSLRSNTCKGRVNSSFSV